MSNSYSKKTQSNNTENKRPEEDRESGRKASSTAKVPASPLPGLERKKTTPTPSTVSVPPARPLRAAPSGSLPGLASRAGFAYCMKPTPHEAKQNPFFSWSRLCEQNTGFLWYSSALCFPQNSVLSTSTNRSRNSPLLERTSLGQASIQNGKDR